MSVGGRKLTPLPLNNRAVLGGDNNDGTPSPNDGQENKPLLSKEPTSLQVTLKSSSVLNDAPELFPYGSCQPKENGRVAHEEKQHETEDGYRSDYNTFDKPGPIQKSQPDTFQEEAPTLEVSTTQMFPQSPILPPSSPSVVSAESPSPSPQNAKISSCLDSEPNAVAAIGALQVLNDDLDNSRVKGETFELQFENTSLQKSPRLSPKYRSMSSSESSPNVKGNSAARVNTCQRQVRHRNDDSKRAPLSRSQSHPLTTDESEYSQYWRGQVTIIETPDAILPAVQKQASLELDEQFMASPLARSILKGDHRLVLECLKQGENPNVTCSRTGKGYLHLMAGTATPDDEVKWVPMIYQLSNAGVDVNAKDGDGRSAARISIIRRLVQVLAALLKCGSELDLGDEYYAEQARGVVKSQMLEIIRRLTPSYWSAVHELTSFKVNRLVKSWARVNVSRNGQTLIEYAKQNAKEGTVVKLLLQHEASIELAHAVMAGDADRARVLLCDSGADLTTADTSVKANYFDSFAPLTLFGAAIKYGHENVLEVLRSVPTWKDMKIGTVYGSNVDAEIANPCRRPHTDGSPSKPLLGETHHYGSNLRALDVKSSDSVTSMLCRIL